MSIEQTLKSEPKSVRDHFDRLAKVNLDNDDSAGLQEALNEARERQTAARKVADRLGAIIDQQREAVRVKAREIEHLRAKRPEALAVALLDEADFTEDDKIVADITRFEMEIERSELAIQALESRLAAARGRLDRCGRSAVETQIRLQECRDALRLEEARRRATA